MMLMNDVPFLCSLLASAALVSTYPLEERSSSPVVDLGYAKYQGTSLQNGVSQWLGIRYAAPPVGDLRFRAPADPISNSTLQIADTPGFACLSTGVTKIAKAYSEDCLFLDVYAPTTSSAQPTLKPVYVFIQGGGFNTNANLNYNGSGLVTYSNLNIVVVTFNYRVGPYGFLASKEVQDNGNLNNGLKDQRKVFQWVQKNIEKFGGDPNKVTIGGDSAGGASVDLHLSAYGGRDDHLFHAAAAESASFGVQFTVEGSQYQYDALVKRAGCTSSKDTLACLRKMPMADLQAINTNKVPTPGGGGDPPLFMYSNVIDGDFTIDYTYKLFQEGKFIKVPVIFGDDTNGGTIFVPNGTDNVAAMNTFMKDQFPKLTVAQLSQIDKYYPKAEQFKGTGAYWRAASNAYGEMRYMCPSLYISSAYSNATTPSWNYRYNVEDHDQMIAGNGVPHTVEVNAIWGPSNVHGAAPGSYSDVNRNAVHLMQGYWTSFIRSHDPNTHREPGSPKWEEWDPSLMNRIKLETNTTSMESVDSGLKERCNYLWGIGIENQQ